MITMQVSFQGTPALWLAFQQAPEVAQHELLVTVERLVTKMSAVAKERWPKDSGNSAQSIFKDAYSVPAGVLGVVASPKPEVAFIELGTKPHWAPLAPLVEWVKRKQGMAGVSEKFRDAEPFALALSIQRAIAARGTKAQGIFKRILEENQAAVQTSLDNAGRRIAKRLQDDFGGSVA